MTQPEQRVAIVAGRPARYRVVGEGPPLALIHGLSGSTRWWSRNLAALSARFQVYAIDLPGFGENRRWGRFRLEEVPARLLAWLDAAGIARASIIGHSMGGFITADLAARAPERVDRLVLVDAPLLPQARGLLRVGLGGAEATRRLPLRFMPILISDALRAGPFTIARAGRSLLAADVSPRLHLVAAPTLVVWGEHDHLFPVDYGRRVAAALPNARFALLPGAGHNAMWDQPAAFSETVLAFLLEPDSGEHTGGAR